MVESPPLEKGDLGGFTVFAQPTVLNYTPRRFDYLHVLGVLVAELLPKKYIYLFNQRKSRLIVTVQPPRHQVTKERHIFQNLI